MKPIAPPVEIRCPKCNYFWGEIEPYGLGEVKIYVKCRRCKERSVKIYKLIQKKSHNASE